MECPPDHAVQADTTRHTTPTTPETADVVLVVVQRMVLAGAGAGTGATTTPVFAAGEMKQGKQWLIITVPSSLYMTGHHARRDGCNNAFSP